MLAKETQKTVFSDFLNNLLTMQVAECTVVRIDNRQGGQQKEKPHLVVVRVKIRLKVTWVCDFETAYSQIECPLVRFCIKPPMRLVPATSENNF